MIDKNLSIGKTFVLRNKKYEVKSGSDCRDCDLFHDCWYTRPSCMDIFREDKHNVIFKEVKDE